MIPAGAPHFTLTFAVRSVTEDGAKIRLVRDDQAVRVNAQSMMRVIINEPTKQIVDVPLSEALKHGRTAVIATVMLPEDRCF